MLCVFESESEFLSECVVCDLYVCVWCVFVLL